MAKLYSVELLCSIVAVLAAAALVLVVLLLRQSSAARRRRQRSGGVVVLCTSAWLVCSCYSQGEHYCRRRHQRRAAADS